MHGRRKWDGRARHPGHSRAPDAAADHGGLGLDIPARGADPPDPAPTEAESGDLAPLHYREGPGPLGLASHQRRTTDRVDDTHAGTPEARQEEVAVRVGDQLPDALR